MIARVIALHSELEIGINLSLGLRNERQSYLSLALPARVVAEDRPASQPAANDLKAKLE